MTAEQESVLTPVKCLRGANPIMRAVISTPKQSILLRDEIASSAATSKLSMGGSELTWRHAPDLDVEWVLILAVATVDGWQRCWRS
jgi:hypothetical protein